jgi:hypothetical protein
MIDPEDLDDGFGHDDDAIRAVPVDERVAIGRGAISLRSYPGGPVLVRGAQEIVEPDGSRVACTRATVALCRCGKSRLGTFCDGTHRFVASA